MRPVLKEDERRFTPWTRYPFASNNSARYAPSCPVTPVIKATLPSRSASLMLRPLQLREVISFEAALDGPADNRRTLEAFPLIVQQAIRAMRLFDGFEIDALADVLRTVSTRRPSSNP